MWRQIRICLTTLSVGVTARSAALNAPATPASTQPAKTGEVLYNGIQLPAEWPPKGGDPDSLEPMEVPYLKDSPKVIPIDIGRQLLVDDFLIAHTDLRRSFHKPEKYVGNPVISPSTPEELNRQKKNQPPGTQEAVCYLGHGGAFYDPTDERFKMWYRAGWGTQISLASSEDGYSWSRVPGSFVLPPPGKGVGDNCLWYDTNTKNPAERYKYLESRESHLLWTSPDGKNWSAPVDAGKAADYCSFFYNPFRDIWAYSVKESVPVRARLRRYAEAKTFLSPNVFDSSVFWVSADKFDLPDPQVGDPAQLYSLNAVAYESLMIGMFYVHVGPHNRVCLATNTPKRVDLKIAFSRDGFHWDRPDHTPFLACTRQDGAWDRGYLHSTAGLCYVAGDKLLFPYTGFSGVTPNGDRGMYAGASIGMATLRRDGFASMDASSEGGTLTTRPLLFTGGYLFVNADCQKGELRAEILDEAGQVITPFSRENCIPVKADKTLQAITWKDTASLSALAGKPHRIRFYLTNGSLYSFWITSETSGASHGYLAGGGPGNSTTCDTAGEAAYRTSAAMKGKAPGGAAKP